MTNKFDEMMNKARDVKITKLERDSLRARIKTFILSNPLPGDPREKLVFPKYSFALFARRHAVLAFVAILFFVGGTGSIFAEKAIPGDSFYGLKIGLNEKVLGWLATSPGAKAEWQLSLADRRIVETEKLVEANRLTPELRANLRGLVEAHTTSALSANTSVQSESKTKPKVANDENLDNVSGPEQASLMMANENAENDAVSLKANFRAVSDERNSTTTVSLDDISILRQQIYENKSKLGNQRADLIRRNLFINAKGKTIIAEQSIIDSQQALQAGNTEKAMEYYLKTKNILDSIEVSIGKTDVSTLEN